MSGRFPHALTAAIDLLRIPSQVRAMRSAPLPPGILLLLRLAAAESEAEREAQRINKRLPNANREAAIFFIEQVLLSLDSDAYRVLGLDRTAENTELRRHMAYLIKWLHPDLSSDPHKARLAQRVLIAWNEIKNAKRCPNGNSDGIPPREDNGIVRRERVRLHFKTWSPEARKMAKPRYRKVLKKRFRMRVWPI